MEKELTGCDEMKEELFSHESGNHSVKGWKSKYLGYLRKAGLAAYMATASIGLVYNKDAYQQAEYRPTLEICVTNEYTAEGAWAHTIPEEKRICIRSPEHIDYNLGFKTVLGHEFGHNVLHQYGLPDGDEDHHTRHAHQHLAYSDFKRSSQDTYAKTAWYNI